MEAAVRAGGLPALRPRVLPADAILPAELHSGQVQAAGAVKERDRRKDRRKIRGDCDE